MIRVETLNSQCEDVLARYLDLCKEDAECVLDRISKKENLAVEEVYWLSSRDGYFGKYVRNVLANGGKVSTRSFILLYKRFSNSHKPLTRFMNTMYRHMCKEERRLLLFFLYEYVDRSDTTIIDDIIFNLPNEADSRLYKQLTAITGDSDLADVYNDYLSRKLQTVEGSHGNAGILDVEETLRMACETPHFLGNNFRARELS